MARRKAPSAPAETIAAEEARRMAECQAAGMRAREQALVSVLSEIIHKMPPLSDHKTRITELLVGDRG